MTPPKKEVLKFKVCCACGKDKEIKNFYKNNIREDGFDGRCKACKIACKKCRQGRRKTKPIFTKQDKNAPMLFNVTQKDWIEMYKFLESIGYSLEENIHIQFCEKHNLTPRKRMREKSLYYSPKDLDMI